MHKQRARNISIQKILQFTLVLCILSFLQTGKVCAAEAGNTSGNSNQASATTQAGVSQNGNFSFAVFGDLNGGGCDKNQRVYDIVALMADTEGTHHPPVDFFLQTGDLVEGYGGASCFATVPENCENGNVQDQLRPLLEKVPPAGLNASFFPIVGNHDGNPGSGWFPDPCGGVLCDLLNMNHTDVVNNYINHPLNQVGTGDICDHSDATTFRNNFYYSFTHQNSYFIVLQFNDDYYSSLDPDEFQYDWLEAELSNARQQGYEHLFVFGHAVLLGSGDNHRPYRGAAAIRALLEQYDVDIYFNGHNHAYERTHPVRGNAIDETGTTYITTGTGGATVDDSYSDWFTARRIGDWAQYWNYYPHTTSYLVISINGTQITGDVYTLDESLSPADTDHFELETCGTGDVNGNGTVDSLDAVLALQVASGLTPADITMEGDADNDGRIGVADAIKALRTTAGLTAE